MREHSSNKQKDSTELVVWGNNKDGQLGIGDHFVRQNLSDVKIIYIIALSIIISFFKFLKLNI